MAGTNISFGGNSLQTANIITQDIDHSSIPSKDAKVFPLSHANQSIIPFVSYPSRTVKVSGMIYSTTGIANMDSQIDTFNSYLVGAGQNLDIDYNGSTRRYIATVNNATISRPGNLAYAHFSIEFICPQPFGQDTSTTTALNATGRTLGAYTDSYTFGGTAPAQLPIATITYSAITGTTGTVQWGNAGNGQAISVNRTWGTTDVLVIDCIQRTVTVNGAAVNFTGAFPEFPTGAQSFSYADGFTTRTFTENVIYTKYYL